MIYFLPFYTDKNMKSKGHLMSPGPHTELALAAMAQVPADPSRQLSMGVEAQVGAKARMRPSASPRRLQLFISINSANR